MLKIVMAEDDSSMRLILKRVLVGLDNVEIIGEAKNGIQLVEIVEQNNPDVIFVDIDMPEKNGLDAAKEIFDFNPKIFIVFVTAFDNFTHEAFQLYAFDYLVKPFNIERVKNTVNRIKELKQTRDKTTFQEFPIIKNQSVRNKYLIQSNEKSVILNTEDIILVTRIDRKTVFITNQETHQCYDLLRNVNEFLDSRKFFRCHKGYIINTDMVQEIIPWGYRTYLVKLANTKETALMTYDKAKYYFDNYCI